MQKSPQSRSHSRICTQADINSPQVKLYNRHFFIRQAEHDLIQKQYDESFKKLANTPKITVASYNILSQKLEQRALEIIKQSINSKKKIKSKDQENYRLNEETLDFRQLQNILMKLTGLSQEKGGIEMEHLQSQLWLILVRYKLDAKVGVNAALLYSVLRVLFDPYNLNVKQLETMFLEIPQFRQANQRRNIFLRQYPDLEEETLTLSEILKLWRKIRYCNPHFGNIEHYRKQQNRAPSFKPQLNQKTRRLADQSLRKYLHTHNSLNSNNIQTSQKNYNSNQLTRYLDNSSFHRQVQEQQYQLPKMNYHQILYRRKLKKDQVCPIRVENEELFERRNYNDQSNYRSADQIKQIVNSLYYVKPKREDVDHYKVKEEKQLKQCTFSPVINKEEYYRASRSKSPNVGGYSKQVDRMQRGRKQRQRKRLAYQNLGRVKNAHKYSTSKSPSRQSTSRRSQAPSFLARDTPKLILEINIDGNRIEKLPLKGDQNPRLAAKRFAKMHGLQDEMIQVLEQLISEQLQKL